MKEAESDQDKEETLRERIKSDISQEKQREVVENFLETQDKQADAVQFQKENDENKRKDQTSGEIEL